MSFLLSSTRLGVGSSQLLRPNSLPLLLNTLKHTRWNSSSSGGDNNNNNNNNNDDKNLQDNLLEELKASFDELAIIDAQKESAQKEYAHKHGKSADPSTRLSSTEAISNLAKAVEKEVGSTTTLSADTISTMVARLPVHLRESFPVLNGFALPKPEYIEMLKQTYDPPKAHAILIKIHKNGARLSLSDHAGRVETWVTTGSAGFKNSRKSTAFAAQQATILFLKKARQFSPQRINVFISGFGALRNPVMKLIGGSGLKIISYTDVTPIPHNGCRPRKARRL